MNLLDRVPTQACQFCHILDRANPAKVDDKAFQRSGVMFFGIGKCKVWLPDGSTIFTVKPRYINNQFDLAAADGKHFEGSWLVAESDYSARSAARALQRVRMNISIEDRLVQKSAFLYCTPDIPNV